MQIVTGRRGEPHVTSRQMQAVYRSFLGDFALLDVGEKLRAEAYSNDIVRVYDGVVSVQGIYAVIAYNQYDEVYIEPVSVGKKRIDTIVLHYTKDNALDVEDMQLDVVQGEEYTDNPIAPVVPEGGDAWEGTTDIQVPIYDVEITNFGLTVTPYARMLNLIPTLESIAERIPETFVTGVKGDSEVSYRDGDVNITKANIGLGNVDNTADTDKPISTATQTALNLKADLTYVDAKISAAYHAGGSKTVAELTSALLIADNIGKVYNMSDSGVTTSDFVEGAGEPINEGDNVGICNVGTEESPVYKFDLLSGFVDLSAYATTSAVNAGLEGKVDKVAGKGLSTEDYTTTDKTKLAGISEGATQTIANPADTATETLSKLEVGGVVYDVPQGASGATELSELTDVNLSDVEDGDILQYDEPTNKWKNSNVLQGSKTTTGNPLTITDAAPVNAVNLSMDLEPVQDLHGYDHPWVGGAGKNKLYLTNIQTKSESGITVTAHYENSELCGYKLSGTSEEVVDYYALQSYGSTSATIPSGSYKLTCDGLVNGIEIHVGYGSNTLTQMTTSEEVNFEAPNGISWLIVRVKEGVTLDNVTIKPMIRLATETDSSFAPYTNICPISGRSEVAIDRVGKNLLQPQTTRNIKFGGSASTGYTLVQPTSTSLLMCGEIKVEGLQSIYLSGDLSALSNSTFRYTFTSEYPNVGVETFNSGAVGTNNAITVPSNAKWLVWGSGKTETQVSDEGGYTKLSNTAMINAGSTATTYEPYTSKTYTIQIGDTIYGGELDVITGKMRGTHGEVDLGSLTYQRTNNFYYCALPNAKTPSSNSTPFNGISDRLEVVSANAINKAGVIALTTTGNIYTTTTDYDGGSLVSPTGQLVYELAEPYTIQLTPQQIKMLENTNTISSDGSMTLEYQPNNAIGEAMRVVEESYDPEFAVRPVLKKKAFSGTTDSDGSVTLINASDIPSNHRIIPLQITDMTIGGSAGTYFVEYEPYNSGDAVKGYCYTFFNGSRITPVGSAVTGNFYYYELEV